MAPSADSRRTIDVHTWEEKRKVGHPETRNRVWFTVNPGDKRLLASQLTNIETVISNAIKTDYPEPSRPSPSQAWQRCTNEALVSDHNLTNLAPRVKFKFHEPFTSVADLLAVSKKGDAVFDMKSVYQSSLVATTNMEPSRTTTTAQWVSMAGASDPRTSRIERGQRPSDRTSASNPSVAGRSTAVLYRLEPDDDGYTGDEE